jgi:hypothetical protein
MLGLDKTDSPIALLLINVILRVASAWELR